LSGGLGGALWLSPALSVPSPAALTKAAAEAKAQQFAEDQKQLFGLQTDARAATSAKEAAKNELAAARKQVTDTTEERDLLKSQLSAANNVNNERANVGGKSPIFGLDDAKRWLSSNSWSIAPRTEVDVK
jgi:hypothetical protein